MSFTEQTFQMSSDVCWWHFTLCIWRWIRYGNVSVSQSMYFTKQNKLFWNLFNWFIACKLKLFIDLWFNFIDWGLRLHVNNLWFQICIGISMVLFWIVRINYEWFKSIILQAVVVDNRRFRKHGWDIFEIWFSATNTAPINYEKIIIWYTVAMPQ